MPKAQPGTAKYAAKQMRLSGRQRLRYFCQACGKQCRDSNGYKMHTQSALHLERAGAADPRAAYSRRFEQDFLRLLRMSHGTQRVDCNRFYQEYILDRNHIHMNATRWTSLTAFVRAMAAAGRVVAAGDPIEIAYVEVGQAKDREKVLRSDEAAAARLLERQIAEGHEAQESGQGTGHESGQDTSQKTGKDTSHESGQETNQEEPAASKPIKFALKRARPLGKSAFSE